MNRLITASLLTLAALATLRPAAAQTPRYHVIELPLVTNAKTAGATAINNPQYDAAGKLVRPVQVVGATLESTVSKSYHGWIWTASTATAAAKIQALIPLKNFPRSWATDINNTGQVVGKSYGNGQTATLWQASAPLSPINFNDPAVKGTVLPNCYLTDAFALSDTDATTGAYYVTGRANYTDPVTNVVSRWQGVVWKMQGAKMVTGARLQYPDAPPANLEDLTIDPWDVNNLGQVAGDYENWQATAASTPCIWNAEDGTMVQRLISPVEGSYAHAINNNGSVVGESWGTNPPHAFLWATPGAGQEIQILTDPSGSHTVARGINKSNQIVGQMYSRYGGPCLWQPQLDGTYQYYNLNKCKYSGATGITLQVARKVNDSGRIIGSYSSGSAGRAFLLTPVP